MKSSLLLLLLLPALAVCQNGAAPWPQEPVSFLGIAFDQPIRASIVECPKVTEYGSTSYEWVGFGRPCFEFHAGFYDVFNISPFFNIYVTELDGKVECISAKFNNGKSANLSGIDAEGIAAALIDKFGQPYSSRSEQLTNNAGAAFENKVLIWLGKNVEIDFDSISGEYNHGRISAFTSVYVADSKKREGQQKKAVQDSF